MDRQFRFPHQSYALKLRRAEKHLDELDDVLAAYIQSKPAVLVRDGHPKRDPRTLVVRTQIVKQPPPEVPVIVGDFIYNARSALDHLAAALVPRRRRSKAKFLIYTEDCWRTDPDTGAYVDSSESVEAKRQSWASAAKGMDPAAEAIIKGLQPYTLPQPDFSSLAVLNALRNSDAHHELTAITYASRGGTLVLSGTAAGVPWHITAPLEGTMEVGQAIEPLTIKRPELEAQFPGMTHDFYSGIMASITGKAEMDMKLQTTLLVGIKAGRLNGYLAVEDLGDMLGFLVTRVVWPLEPFVRIA